jgi:hypothetical protein
MSSRVKTTGSYKSCISLEVAKAQCKEAQAIAKHDFLFRLRRKHPDLVISKPNRDKSSMFLTKLAFSRLRCPRKLAKRGEAIYQASKVWENNDPPDAVRDGDRLGEELQDEEIVVYPNPGEIPDERSDD